MGLVDHDVGPVGGVLAVEERAIRGTQEQVLEHGVVGEQDVRGRALHLLAGDELVGQRFLAVVELLVFLDRSLGGLFRLAGVAAECDVRDILEHLAQTLDLVVGERVHGVKQKCTHAGAEFAGVALAQQVVNDGHEEALRLTGAGTSGDHEVAASLELADGGFLVLVERARLGQSFAQFHDGRGEDAFGDEFLRGLAGCIGRSEVEDWPLGERRGVVHGLIELGAQSRSLGAQERLQVAAVVAIYACGCGDGVDIAARVGLGDGELGSVRTRVIGDRGVAVGAEEGVEVEVGGLRGVGIGGGAHGLVTILSKKNKREGKYWVDGTRPGGSA